MYRQRDVALLAGIKKLLRDDGMTIKGAQKILLQNGKEYVASLAETDAAFSALRVDSGSSAESPENAPKAEAGGESRATGFGLARASPADPETAAQARKAVAAKPEIAQEIYGNIQSLRKQLAEKIYGDRQ